MGFVDNIKQKAFAMKVSQTSNLSSEEFEQFVRDHTNFVATEFEQINSAIIYRTKPSSSSVEKLFELSKKAIDLSNKLNAEYTDGVFIKYADTILEIRDVYDTIMNAFYLMGYSDGVGFTQQENYELYTIRQFDTIRSIAKDKYNDPQKSSDIIRANPWLMGLTPEQYRFKEIKLPRATVRKASISTNLGDESWGVDLPNILEADFDGDLKVLTYKESLLQDVTNIVCWGLRSVPEDDNVGNAFINQIGASYLVLNPLIAANALKRAVMLDEAVEDFIISDLKITEDAFSASLRVKPINSNKIFELNL